MAAEDNLLHRSSPWIVRREDDCSSNTWEFPCGALQGIRFAVKGCIAVAGERLSFGNPTWDSEQSVVQEEHAPCVMALVANGAHLIGTTKMDEMALGVTGENPHYCGGAPWNPKAPDRVPGGSSSGSAAVVADGEVDIALGTDTGGSIRVPASWTGVWGIRTTVGLLDTTGVIPNSDTLDCVGALARNGELLCLAVQALVQQSIMGAPRKTLLPMSQDAVHFPCTKVLLLSDLWEQAEPPVQMELQHWLLGRKVSVSSTTLAELLPEMSNVSVDTLKNAFLCIGMAEVWKNRREWVESHSQGALSSELQETFKAFSAVENKDVASALRFRDKLREGLEQSILPGHVLTFPTTPSPAPLRSPPAGAYESAAGLTSPLMHMQLQMLCSLSSLSGWPEVTIPVGWVDEAPVGLSFLGRAGEDVDLVHRVIHITCDHP